MSSRQFMYIVVYWKLLVDSLFSAGIPYITFNAFEILVFHKLTLFHSTCNYLLTNLFRKTAKESIFLRHLLVFFTTFIIVALYVNVLAPEFLTNSDLWWLPNKALCWPIITVIYKVDKQTHDWNLLSSCLQGCCRCTLHATIRFSYPDI